MAYATNLVLSTPVNITMKKSKVKVQFPKLGPQYAKQSVARQQNLVKNPVTRDQATEQARAAITQSGIPPSAFVTMGKLAEAAIKDKKKYPAFVKFMVDNGLEKAEDLKKPDVQMMTTLIVLGMVARDMGDQEVAAPVTA